MALSAGRARVTIDGSGKSHLNGQDDHPRRCAASRHGCLSEQERRIAVPDGGRCSPTSRCWSQRPRRATFGLHRFARPLASNSRWTGDHDVELHARAITRTRHPTNWSRPMRASFLGVGPLLAPHSGAREFRPRWMRDRLAAVISDRGWAAVGAAPSDISGYADGRHRANSRGARVWRTSPSSQRGRTSGCAVPTLRIPRHQMTGRAADSRILPGVETRARPVARAAAPTQNDARIVLTSS